MEIERNAEANGLANGHEVDVTNEFAVVKVRKVETRNGARLEISSARLGYVIQLDALALESLTWQTMDTFSGFLRTPLGPTHHDEDHQPTDQPTDFIEPDR